jgi:hypothetical protein
MTDQTIAQMTSSYQDSVSVLQHEAKKHAQHLPLFRHCFGAGISYVEGDGISLPNVMLTGMYAYRFTYWLEVEANLNMFQSNNLKDALNTTNNPQYLPSFNVGHITSLDIAANFSPFSIPWNNLQISLGAGVRRYTGFRNTLVGAININQMPYTFTQNYYHDRLEPYLVGRLNYNIPLSEHLALSIRVGLAVIHTYNAQWLSQQRLPPNVQPTDIPENSWNNALSQIGCNLRISL